MKRLLASVLLVWYAVLSMGFYLHVHYCCGELADIAINQAIEKCEGACSSHHEKPKSEEKASCCMAHAKAEIQQAATCSIEKSCCSSDDFYIALEELHTKSDVDLNFALVPIKTKLKTFEPAPLEVLNESFLDSNPANGPPLYLLYGQVLHYL